MRFQIGEHADLNSHLDGFEGVESLRRNSDVVRAGLQVDDTEISGPVARRGLLGIGSVVQYGNRGTAHNRAGGVGNGSTDRAVDCGLPARCRPDGPTEQNCKGR